MTSGTARRRALARSPTAHPRARRTSAAGRRPRRRKAQHIAGGTRGWHRAAIWAASLSLRHAQLASRRLGRSDGACHLSRLSRRATDTPSAAENARLARAREGQVRHARARKDARAPAYHVAPARAVRRARLIVPRFGCGHPRRGAAASLAAGCSEQRPPAECRRRALHAVRFGGRVRERRKAQAGGHARAVRRRVR